MSLESKIIKFYNNNYPANNKKNYYLNDILTNWSDLELETAHDFIQWLFPDEKGGQNSNSEKLTVKDVEIFKNMKHERIIPYLVAAVQHLHRLVKNLQNN